MVICWLSEEQRDKECIASSIFARPVGGDNLHPLNCEASALQTELPGVSISKLAKKYGKLKGLKITNRSYTLFVLEKSIRALPFTRVADICIIRASILYALLHPCGVRSSMQIAPPFKTYL